REVDDPVVRAIGGNQARRLEAAVDRELVERVEAVGRLLAPERGEVLAGAIEPVDVVARVPVGDVDVAVWRDVDAGEDHAELPAPGVSDLEGVRDGGGRDGHRDGP